MELCIRVLQSVSWLNQPTRNSSPSATMEILCIVNRRQVNFQSLWIHRSRRSVELTERLMKIKSIYILAALLALSACTHSTTAPSMGKNSSPIPPLAANASLDFGVVPLWREADTNFVLHLNTTDSITSVLTSDSDWKLLNSSPLIIFKQDSTAALNIRYQPESLKYHVGTILLFSGQDTLGLVSLKGSTSAFVRHVGDSYIFQTSSGVLDSVVVSKLPLAFSCSLKTHIASELGSVAQDSNGDWIMGNIGDALGRIRLPIATGIPFDSSFSGFDSTMFGEYNGGYHAALANDTINQVENEKFASRLIDATGQFTSYKRPEYHGSGGFFHASYIDSIAMLCSIQDWYWNSTSYGYEGPGYYETYHLIRFHFHR
jgi:hypothetical protein